MPAKRILLIEDEPAARDGLARLLTDEGHTVCTLASGSAAIEQLLAFRPEVVICDYYLADLTGLQVLRRVRSIANIPVTFIVVTASCGGADTERVLRREADHFFQKPLDVGRLRDLLRAIARPRPVVVEGV